MKLLRNIQPGFAVVASAITIIGTSFGLGFKLADWKSTSNDKADAPERALLWVDDNPQANAHEMKQLRLDGWGISESRSTSQAIDALTSADESPDIIITDMTRREGISDNSKAGLDLIRTVRGDLKSWTPIVVYTTPEEAQLLSNDVARVRGDGITSSPIELFRLINALVRR